MAEPFVRQYDESLGPVKTGVPLRAYRLTSKGKLVVDWAETILSARVVGAQPTFEELYVTPKQQEEFVAALKASTNNRGGTEPEHEGRTTESTGRPRHYFEVAVTVGSVASRYL